LVVEDEVKVARTLKGLESERYQFVVAPMGEEGFFFAKPRRSTWSSSTGCFRAGRAGNPRHVPPPRPADPGADPDGEGRGRRSGSRVGQRGGRLHSQAVCVRRAARADPGVASARADGPGAATEGA